jgi:hypothetical protein
MYMILRMNVREVGYESAHSIEVAKNRVLWQTFVNMVMIFQVP